MEVKFSNWCRWTERDKVLGQDLRSPGVYLIARNLTRRTRASPLSPNIIYIGETTTPLAKRLNAFEAASQYYYRGSHAGGNSLFKAEVYSNFQQTRDKYKASHGKEAANEAMRHIIEEFKDEFDEKWISIRQHLWVAIWIPSYGVEERYESLPAKYIPKIIEVYLQAEFYLSNNCLPRYNKQIG